MAVAEIVDQVQENGLPMVLLTGGEPLLQKDSAVLMRALLDAGIRVLLETSGTVMGPHAVTLDQVPAGVNRVVDLKAPGSGISSKIIDWQSLATLGPDDEIKVVCAGHEDYLWARDLVLEGGHWAEDLRVSFSPVQDSLPPRDLAEWILEDRLNVCFQIQLHKAVWPEIDRGV